MGARLAGKITYIATPLGHLDAPHWRSVAAYPGGDTAIVIGIQLRDLAAQIQHYGRLVLPSGTPMTIPMLAAALGRDATQVEFALGLLTLVGTVTRDGVTICVTDPLLLEHFKRTAAIAIPDKTVRKRALSAGRSKRYRQRKKNEAITPKSRLRHDDKRDESAQQSKITCGLERHDMCIGYTDISSSEKHPGGDEEIDHPELAPVLIDIPLHKIRQIKPIILAALEAGHTLHACQLAITEGKKASDPKRSPWGLVQYYLRELAKAKPQKKTETVSAPEVFTVSETQAAEEVFEWVEKQ